MNIDSAFPSKYLKASDLNGRTVKVKIGAIKMEEVGDDSKPCLYFEGKDKGIVLNKTNSNNIAGEYGRETDNWIGNDVWLYTALVDFQGKTVEAIRVRTTAPPAAAGIHEPVSQREMREAAPAPGEEDLDDEIPF